MHEKCQAWFRMLVGEKPPLTAPLTGLNPALEPASRTHRPLDYLRNLLEHLKSTQFCIDSASRQVMPAPTSLTSSGGLARHDLPQRQLHLLLLAHRQEGRQRAPCLARRHGHGVHGLRRPLLGRRVRRRRGLQKTSTRVDSMMV